MSVIFFILKKVVKDLFALRSVSSYYEVIV